MADNVQFQAATLATPASGVTVATDDVAGAQYQRFKLDVGGDGASVPVVGTIPLGTVQVLGSVQIAGTMQVLGSVQAVGTSQALGTFQPLAGSVHLASTLPGTVQVLGSIQGVGTFQVLGSVQTVGTSQALGTFQPLAGSVHLASGTVQVLGTIQAHGTSQVLGTVQTHGTSQVLGSVQTVGTSQVLGSVQTVGTTQVLGTVQTQGTSQALGTVRTLAPVYVGESFFGTIFTAAVTNGTLVPAPSAGTYIRVYDLIASGSAAGTAFFEMGDGTVFAPIFTADKGGLSFNSTKGVRTRGTALDILFNCSAGTWGVSVNYALET